MTSQRLAAVFVLLLAGTTSLVGCGSSRQPSADGAQWLLASEPPDAMGVLDLREALPVHGPITLVGQIGGVSNPWSRGEASFIVADASLLSEDAEDAHDHGACGDNCPYCQKQKEDRAAGLALVRLVDRQGHVLSADPRELLGLAEQQTVVVRGNATLDSGGHLVVAASGLYVRR